jgi:transketolase
VAVDLANPEMKKTREGFGRALVELGEKDERIVVLVGDLSDSTMVSFFEKRFPDRFIECGIAEQNMTNIAAGLAVTGKIPFYSTYGAFASLRGGDQLRVTVCYTDLNVNVGGAHGGISVGPDGATHQAMEEISCMRVMPNMQVCVPADFWETKKATMTAAYIDHPCYIRFGRENVPVVTDESTPFTWGKGYVMRDGGDVALLACGPMVYESLVAAEELAKEGIDARVVNIHTVKPIDRELIVKCAKECGAIVTAEEHQVYGGFGGAISEVVVQEYPVPVEFVAVMDRFGVSGKPEELMHMFGIKAPNIVSAAKKALSRKRGK